MPANAVPVSQIRAQAESVLERDRDAKVIAMHADAKQDWPEAIVVAGRRFDLRWCASVLMTREALEELGDTEGSDAGLIVLTPIAQRELGNDVLARFARARVFQLDAWGTVLQMFKARETDARLRNQRWMAQLLVDQANGKGYAPVANGFLDLDTAWRQVLARSLRLDMARPDAVTLLRWTLEPDAAGFFRDLPDNAKPAVAAWLAAAGGAVSGLVMACALANHLGDALPLGLACGVVLSPQGEGVHELAAASVRLERYLGNKRVGIDEGRAWALESSRALQGLAPTLHLVVSERAEELLGHLHVQAYAHLSDVLELGREQRLSQLATELGAFVAEPARARLGAIEKSYEQVLAHSGADPQSTRMRSVAMAMRLCRWLALGETPATCTGLPALAASYAEEGAFVDWARFKLIGGDQLPELSAAFNAIREAVRARTEVFNRSFGVALQAWSREARAEAGCVPVEAILERVLAPLAQQHPVLLLVVDGLSCGIFRELCEELETLGWEEQVAGPVQSGEPARTVGIAALPTITEVSRASLLCGRITSGQSGQEKAGFASHAALVAASRSGEPPLVFHKGDLSDSEGLSSTVREALASSRQRVVGVVYNAVDDQLSGSNQLSVRWTIENLRLLGPLLLEARRARRAVLITADHGHVLDDGTVQRGQGDGDRWRTPGGPLDAAELLFDGPRVKAPSGNTVACLWSEGVRHGAKKNGYHGGVAAAEVVVPLAVFAPASLVIPGWQPVAVLQPPWWQLLPQEAAPAPAPTPPRGRARAKPVAATHPDLFGDQPPPPAAAAPKLAGTSWVAGFLASPIYASQRTLAARVAPADADIATLLEALSARGGKLSKPALAQRLAMPAMRVSGFVSAAKRVLNIDQAPVLILDETAGTVELNRELLVRQFRLEVR